MGIIVYSNTFLCSFHFDDDLYIINNFSIRNIQNLADIWNICPCRFITFLSLAINYHFSQLHVLGYHLFNTAVHLGSAIFVWWLCYLTFLTPTMKNEKIIYHAQIISLFTGLLFICHPVQTEAVTYIWQRATSMAALFYLASLCFYIKSRLLQINKSKSWELYLKISLTTAIMAMFTKENSISLPLMIFLYESCFFSQGIKEVKSMWAQLYPFWLTLFIIPMTMVLTNSFRFHEIQTIINGPGGISPVHYLLTQFRVIITYIRLSFLPLNLNIDYDYPIFKSFFAIPVIASFLFLTGVLYSAKQMFAKYRILSFSIFWFFLTLLPESSILPQEDVIFEHRLYLPLAGFCIFLSSSAYYLLGKKSIQSMIIILSILIAAYSVMTYQRNKIWINEITLWKDVIQKSPQKARAHNNLGWAYYNKGDFIQAMIEYNIATEINPDYIFPYDDRGLIYTQEGYYKKAISEFNKAVKINPYYAKIFYDRGLAYFKENSYTQAISDYNKAIELNPELINAPMDSFSKFIKLKKGNL